MRRPAFLPSLFAASLLVATLASCGKKPDGTPYGVDPAKLPEGRQPKATATYKQDTPKGAELNAATNSARTGQPTSAAPAPAAR